VPSYRSRPFFLPEIEGQMWVKNPIILAKRQLNFKNFEYNSDICQFLQFLSTGVHVSSCLFPINCRFLAIVSGGYRVLGAPEMAFFEPFCAQK